MPLKKKVAKKVKKRIAVYITITGLFLLLVVSLNFLNKQVVELKKEVVELRQAIPSVAPTAIPTQTAIEPTTKPVEPKVSWNDEKAEQFKRVAIEKGYSEEAVDMFLREFKASGLSAEEFSERIKENRIPNALEDIAWELQMIKIRL